MENENKKSKKGLAIAIIAIIIIAIIAGAAYYLLMPKSPKDVFISKINASIDEANAANNQNAEKINSTITLSGNIETTNEELAQVVQIINGGKLTINAQLDTNAKKMLVGADVDFQNEKYLGAKALYQSGDSNLYVFVQDLFDKYFKIDMTEALEDEETKEAFDTMEMYLEGKMDSKTANQILKDTIAKNLKDEYFSKEDIDGMTKNTMKLTIAELRSLFTNILTELKNNEKFLNCFGNSGKIVSNLEESLKSIEEMDNDYDTAILETSIYTKGVMKNVQKFDARIVVSEAEEGTFTINKIDENNSEFVAEVKGTTNGVPYTAEALKGTIQKEKVDNDTTKTTIVAENVPNVGKVTINIEVKNSQTIDIENIDTSSAVDFNNMTQTEMMTLYTNLQKMKIYSIIQPLIAESGDSIFQTTETSKTDDGIEKAKDEISLAYNEVLVEYMEKKYSENAGNTKSVIEMFSEKMSTLKTECESKYGVTITFTPDSKPEVKIEKNVNGTMKSITAELTGSGDMLALTWKE